MIRDILEAAGYKTGLLGTIDYEIGEEKKRAERTTPEAIDIQRYLRKMADSGCRFAVMEVSSQGLKLHRSDGILFDVGVFTNLGRDHIGPKMCIRDRGCDLYRNNFRIETIEYDIWGPDFMKPNEKILYKHIDESLVKKAPGHMLIISGIERAEKDKVIKRLLERYPDEYAWYDDHNFRKINAGIYKKCYEGKTVIVRCV